MAHERRGGPDAWSRPAAMKTAVSRYLEENGWEVLRYARQRGWVAPADIEATRAGRVVLIEVLGHPNREDGERPSKQWLKAERSAAEAVFTAMLLRSDSPDCEVKIALPDVNHYLRLVRSVRTVLREDALEFLVVSADGSVQSWQEWERHRDAIDRAESEIRLREIEAELDAVADEPPEEPLS